MANVEKGYQNNFKNLDFGVINTQNFGPYLSGHFLEHRSVFVYILYQV